jgi:hypothetical protein
VVAYYGGMTQPQSSNPVPDAPELTWTRSRGWGTHGFTYRAELSLNGSSFTFVVDQPRKGEWQVRGWRDGEFRYFRDGRLMRLMKDEAQDIVDDIVDGVRK